MKPIKLYSAEALLFVVWLQIHVAIAISPGGRLVQAYKTRCRAYVSQLKADAKRKASERDKDIEN